MFGNIILLLICKKNNLFKLLMIGVWRIFLIVFTNLFCLQERNYAFKHKICIKNNETISVIQCEHLSYVSFKNGFRDCAGDIAAQLFAAFAYEFKFLHDLNVRFWSL